jgi:hypothetical protein
VLVLSQFLLRLSFGLAIGMAVTSSRTVTSGFFKTHLWVVLGLCTLALLVAVATPGFPQWPPLVAAVLSYVGSVLWIYEAKRAGRIALVLVAGVALAGAWLLPFPNAELSSSQTAGSLAITLAWLDVPLAGLLLGFTMTAMFLGHWYLNTPTMQLVPLQGLLIWMAIATLLRALLSALGLGLELTTTDYFTGPGAGTNILLVTLRWLWGILGVGGLTWMAWQTLKIPNTQSATGILYVAVIGVFLGELTAQLLSARLLFPV